MMNNPDILSVLLDDLSQKLRDLNHRISHTTDDGEQLKNVSSDQTEQARFDTSRTAHVKDQDERTIHFRNIEVNDMLGKANVLMARIAGTKGELDKLQSSCYQSTQYWNSELSIAISNLQTWTNHRNLSIQNMANARAKYNRAEANYNNARWNYNNCMNAKDSQGRRVYANCSGYSAQMSAAQSDMNEAKREYAYWESELAKAEREIRRWEARIAHCRNSLHLLQQASTEINGALNLVSEAGVFALKSLEEIHSAKAVIQKARSLNHEQDLLVQQNAVHIQTALRLSEDSQRAYMKAYKLAGQVQFYGNTASDEINRKVDLLREFSMTQNS